MPIASYGFSQAVRVSGMLPFLALAREATCVQSFNSQGLSYLGSCRMFRATFGGSISGQVGGGVAGEARMRCHGPRPL